MTDWLDEQEQAAWRQLAAVVLKRMRGAERSARASITDRCMKTV